MAIRFIDQLNDQELAGKKVFVRVDFDITVDQTSGQIDDFRIVSHKRTIDYLLSRGAKVMLVSHISAMPSFLSIKDQIAKTLERELVFTELKPDFIRALDDHNLVLLENVRQDEREIANNPEFARFLASGFDLYVNDAFAACHREHASISAIAKLLPAYGGLLVKLEIENLSLAVDAPVKGKVLVMGGAKISTKLPVINNFTVRAEKILIGGAIMNNIFLARGRNVGKSVVDETASSDVSAANVILPEDVVITTDSTGIGEVEVSSIRDLEPNEMMVDIGPVTSEIFAKQIRQARLVIWNGPMGLVESGNFAKGTRVIAQACGEVERSIIGGGDTIMALKRFGILDKMSYVSTGGGAMLKFLAGNKLPGLEALNYY